MSGFDSDTIDKILALAESEVVNIDGRDYLKTIHDLNGVRPPDVDVISTSLLQGVVDFMDTEGIEPEDVFLHVRSASDVVLSGKMRQAWRDRESFVHAEAHRCGFSFSHWYGHEEFIIALMTQFEQCDDVAKILSITGNIADARVIERSDDGVTQEVTLKEGLTRKAEAKIENPFELSPYRTFIDLPKQPASKFIFRMKSGQGSGMPTFALFQADGELWQMEAIRMIVDWFKGKNEALKVVA